jgi:hypothetical protein
MTPPLRLHLLLPFLFAALFVLRPVAEQSDATQQALRGVDKGWSLKLGTKADADAKAFLDQNNANLFTVKDEYEFRDGSTDGEHEISDLSKSEFETLSSFYRNNINRATSSNPEGSIRIGLQELKTEREQAVDALGDMTAEDIAKGILGIPQTVVEDIKNIPDTLNSAGNTIDATLPTTTHDRLNELYGGESEGATLQRELGAGDVLSTMGMATGAGTIGKGIIKGIGRSADGALDIDLQRPTINDNAFDSRPISNADATKLLEERYIQQGISPDRAAMYAQETVDSFEGQITTRMVLDGDRFVVNHNPRIEQFPPSGLYTIKKENANKTPYELQQQ